MTCGHDARCDTKATFVEDGAADSGVDQWIALESIIKHIRYHLGRYGNNIIA